MQDSFSLAAIFATPVMQAGWLALGGVLITRLVFRRHPILKLATQLVFFAALSLILMVADIVPYEVGTRQGTIAETLFVGLAKIIWWTNVAWALVGLVRVFIILERKPLEGRLLQDLIVGLVYLGTVLSVIAYVFGVPIGTLIATSGVFAIILGLALQSTLNDAFSGIALNLGRPYILGDWIKLSDGTEGRVVESNWRSTHLLSASNDLVVLPNSFLAKLGLTNLSSPDPSHGLTLKLRIAPTRMPSVIIEIMQRVLLSCNTIVKDPPPTVALRGLDASALEVELQFRVTNIAQRIEARNEVLDSLYRHTKSSGLMMAWPEISPMADAPVRADDIGRSRHVTPLDLLEAIPMFAALTDIERQKLADSVSVRSYATNEVVVREGNHLGSLMILRSGVVLMSRDSFGQEEELDRLAPGDFFGETGMLTGKGEPGTFRAITAAVLYEIDHESFAFILHERPSMAEDLARILSKRVQPNGVVSSSNFENHESTVKSILKSIHQVFRIKH